MTASTKRIVSLLLVACCATRSIAFAPHRNRYQHKHQSSSLSVSTEQIAASLGVIAAGGALLYLSGSEDRARKQQRLENEARYEEWQAERARKARVEPREYWKESELKQYDGAQSEDGPILLAADGLVFNVYKGRNFYGPGGEYHLFAGRDATRFLAKTIVEEESPEEAAKPLTMGERASLAGWMFTIKGKYEVVGKLEGFDPDTTSMKVL